MRAIRIVISFFAAAAISWLVTYQIAFPTLLHYARIRTVIQRFSHTDEVIWLILTLMVWLFYVQWLYGKLSVIYCYWSFSVYLLLLFIVLFTKAPKYHSIGLDPFDFLVWNRRVLSEALLNFAFFIPLGLIYGIVAKRWEFIVIALGSILAIETLQYVFYLGTFALSDILLNFAGCFVGFWICPRLKQHFSLERRWLE